ncbi:MAG: NAD(P)-dependent alcohol dehydrogenase [Bacteroidota bacterium]
MKAWTIPTHGTLSILKQGTQQKPTCGDDEVLVRVHAAALNPADLKLVSGKEGGHLLHAQNFPITPGFDYSGTIEEKGAHVRDLKVDQDVFGFLPYARSTKQGSLCAYLSVKPEHVSPKPSNVTHAAAAAAGTTGSTALQGLRDKGRLTKGQDVLVNGASGGVGTYAVQIAHHAGAQVFGTCSKKNMAMVKALGAREVFDYKETKVAEMDRQFDIIFDAASNLSFHQCTRQLKRGGVYITLLPSVSLATGIIRSLFSSKASRFVIVTPKSNDLAQLASWLSSEDITSCIDTIYPFDQADKAFQHLSQGVAGKIVVSV